MGKHRKSNKESLPEKTCGQGKVNWYHDKRAIRRGFDTETIDGMVILASSPYRSLWLDDREPADRAEALLNTFAVTQDGPYYVGWNSSYDARAVIACFPKQVQWRLARLSRATWHGWQLRYLPGKLFEARKKRRDGQAICFALFDVYQHYGMSLDKAAKKYLPDCPKLGGELRAMEIDVARLEDSIHKPAKRALIEMYCERDAELAQRLAGLVFDPLEKIGVDTSRPVSGASIAARHFLGRKRTRAPRRENGIAKPAYYGGRVEMLRRGWHDHVWIYDLHSAYPAAMVDLPDLRDCRMRPLVGSREPSRNSEIGIYKVRLRIDAGVHIGPVPVREQVLYYPVGEFDTWVDRDTLILCQDFGYLTTILEGWEWLPIRRVRRPFAAFREFYEMRKQPELKLAVKLLLNGCSGKLAQRDSRWHEVEQGKGEFDPWIEAYLKHAINDGPHTRFALAAALTGRTRARLYRAMMRQPHAVISVATDSIASREPLDLDVGSDMGQWGIEYEDVQMLQIACGVYSIYDRAGDLLKSACRGFHTRADWREVLGRVMPGSFIAPVEVGLPSSLLWSLQQSRQINLIANTTHDINLTNDVKRLWPATTSAGQLLDPSASQASYPRLLTAR